MVAAPDYLRQGDAHVFAWPDVGQQGICVTLDQVRDGRDSVDAEVTVSTLFPVNNNGRVGRIEWCSLNLKAAQTRERLAAQLAEATRLDRKDWSEMLKYAVMRTVEEHRRGEPAVDLATVDVSLDVQYLLYPTVLEGETNMVIADGKSGKSLYALLNCVALARQMDLPYGIKPRRQVRSLYLDWEASKEAHGRRLDWICRGLGFERRSMEGWIHYRRMWSALATDKDAIRKLVAETGAEFIVIDSIGGAAEDELKNTTAARTLFNTVRSFNKTILMVHHLTKAEASGDGPATPFGSVYFKNFARSVDEIRSRKMGRGIMEVHVWNRWVNDGEGREKPICWQVRFDTVNHWVKVTAGDDRMMVAAGGTEYHVRTALLSMGQGTVKELAEEMGQPAKTVYDTLKNMPDAYELIKGARGPKGAAVWAIRAELFPDARK